MIIFGLVGFWGFANLNKRLRELHPSRWEALGDPFHFSFYSLFKELRWMRFVYLRQYAKLDDRQISKFGDLVLACNAVILGLIIVWGLVPHNKGPVML